MEQKGNIILFVVLSAAILGGWYWWTTSNTEPQQKQAQNDNKTKNEPDKEKEEKDKLAAKKKEEDRIAREKAAQEKEKRDKLAKKEPSKEEPLKTTTLGGDGFHLSVDTTTRGAAVRSVRLNHFKAADWHGRPTNDVLELIQDDEHAQSFRMYHYLQPKDEHPVLGLGEKNWKFEDRNRDDASEHWVRYSTTVPGMDDIKIVKTYRLGPKDYHVTLLLEIHDLRTAKGAAGIPFRYQLTGGQGLPIEGEWYTATFRNAFMGLVDPGEGLHRKLEDSIRISQRRGGDTWPDDKYGRGDNRLQYAGVANQYFGVMIVVDNEQPSRDEGGVKPEKILAWARPTLETREKRGVIVALGDNHVVFQDTDSVIARKKIELIIREQLKNHADAKDEITKAVITAQKDLLKRASEIKKMWLSHKERVDPALEAAVTALKQALESLEAERLAPANTAQEEAVANLKRARDELTAPVQYELLPRTAKHFKALDLQDGKDAVLSVYETPDGKHIASWVRLGETLKPQFDDITVRVNSEVIDLHPREVVKHQFMLYHGPVKSALLGQFRGEKEVPAELVDRYTYKLHLRTLTDYHSDNWFSRYVLSPFGITWLIIQFTRLMHFLLNLLHFEFLGYGPAVIMLTIIVRGCMFPISRKQAMFSIKMQELAPELKKITEKYADDFAAKSQATQEFYRKHGINPLGSCWPVFLQMPIFLGLYFALQESIHFRLADFLWITNLAAPDMLFPWSENIPIISTPDSATGFLGALYLGPYLNLLPILAVAFMVVVQMQTMPPPTDEQQAMQQKMLKWLSIVFGVMFYKVAAGLCIYFISSSLWGIAERRLLPKKKPVAEYPGASGATGPGAGALAPKVSPAPKGGGNSKWEKKKQGKEKEKEPVTAFEKLKALWREILKKAEKK